MVSLRRTLAVRFSITMLLALLVIAFWAYQGAGRILEQELDRGLTAVAELEAAVIIADLPISETRAIDRAGFIRSVNRFVVVRNAHGAVLSSNTPLAHDLPVDEESLARALRGESARFTSRWRDDAVRTFLLPLARDAPRDARVVQVAASLAPMRAVSRNVLLLMLGTVVLGMVATLFGAGWLAGSAVAPVAEIAQRASAIEPGEVGQRITAHAGVSEFQGLVRVLNEMLERLDRGVLAQRRIIADVGHDLRTPITAMQGEIEVALRHERPTEQYRATLRSLLEEVHHLSGINETLLTLARIEAGELTPALEPTSVGDVLDEAAARTRARDGDRTVSVSVLPADLPQVAVDRHLLGLALDQLTDNAVRHNRTGTQVRLGATWSPDGVAITVDDDGEGVADGEIGHLFERFYRGDLSRGRSAGAGLGLSVAAAIVTAHEGSIRAQPAPRRGLRVTVLLPAHFHLSA